MKSFKAASVLVSLCALGVALAGAELWGQQAPRRTPPAKKAPAKLGAPPADAAETPAPAPTPPAMKGIWEAVSYAEDITLRDVFFVTAEVGWAAGQGGTILHTTDGGTTWTAQLGGDPESREEEINHLYFLDETHGWAVQGRNLFKTADGELWELAGELPIPYPEVVFTSETQGFMLGHKSFGMIPKQILMTQDGGKSWEEILGCKAKVEVEGLVQTVSCSFEGLQFASPTVGYAVGYPLCFGMGCGGPSLIAKTEDGGASWNFALGPGDPKTTRIQEIFFVDETLGVARATGSGQLFLTTDGGQTWRGLTTTVGKGIRFADPEVGWSLDGSKFTYTTDGGRKWFSREVRFPASVHAFSLPRRDRGYAVGDHGMVFRYRLVPTSEMVPRALAAPAMPAFESPLDEQVAELDEQVEALEEDVMKEAGAEAGEAPAEEGGAEAAAGGEEAGWTETEFEEKVEKLEDTVEAVSAEIPKFTGKFRNLNLVFRGFQVFGEIAGQAQTLKESFKAVRKARDPKSAMAAIGELSTQVQGLVRNTRTAFQQPQH